MKTLKNMILLLALGSIACSGGGGTGGVGGSIDLSFAIASGDVNGDGLTDIVIGHSRGAGNAISIWIQNPIKPGEFTRNVRHVKYSPGALRIADLNDDGRLDITLLSGPAIAVYLQDPVQNGMFPTEDVYTRPSGTSRSILEVGDLNGDGKADIATVGGNGVLIYFQDPAHAGSFLPSITILENIGVTSLAIEDLNGDGLDDVAVGQYLQNKISIYTQDPSSKGSFLFNGEYNHPSPDYIAIADVNGDNEPDIVVTNANSVAIFIQDIDQAGDFIGPTTYLVNTNFDKIAIADLNKDGQNDIATTSYLSDRMLVFIQDLTSPGTFLQPTSDKAKTPFDITVGDFNNDGKLDIALACAEIDYVYFQDPANAGKYLQPPYVIENP